MCFTFDFFLPSDSRHNDHEKKTQGEYDELATKFSREITFGATKLKTEKRVFSQFFKTFNK